MEQQPKTWPRGWAIVGMIAAFLAGRESVDEMPSAPPTRPSSFTSTARPDTEATSSTEDAVAAMEVQADALDAAADEPQHDIPAPIAAAYQEQATPEVYYANCSAARAAGAAPVYAGEPGYAPKLDRDGDGIGCE